MTETTNAQPSAPAAKPATDKSLSMQRSLLIGFLYLANFCLGFSVFVGVVLAYIWRAEDDTPEWEKTHFAYLIRTFWGSAALGLGVIIVWLGAIFGTTFTEVGYGGQDETLQIIFIVFVIGAMVSWLILVAWFCVRCILSIIKAISRQPMPKPKTWLF